jgi:hypothetical protein
VKGRAVARMYRDRGDRYSHTYVQAAHPLVTRIVGALVWGLAVAIITVGRWIRRHRNGVEL